MRIKKNLTLYIDPVNHSEKKIQYAIDCAILLIISPQTWEKNHDDERVHWDERQ